MSLQQWAKSVEDESYIKETVQKIGYNTTYSVVHKNVPLILFEQLHAALAILIIFGVKHQEETQHK